MLSPLRTVAVLLTVVAALAVAGCGSDDKKPTTTATPTVAAAGGTLSAAQYAKLNTAAAKVVGDLSDIGTSTTACAKGATSRTAVTSCVAGRLTTADGELQDLAMVLRDTGNGVSGPCGTGLKAFATGIESLGSSFRSAAAAFKAGDTAKATATLKGLDLTGVQASGTAAQTSCKPK